MSTADELAGRQQALSELHDAILACHRCQDHGYLDQARPIRDGGRLEARVMLVGQAPGARSDRARRHFEGPAGQTLERWFALAGFPPSYFREQVYLSAVTRCFPGKSPGGKRDRLPKPAEVELCRPYLRRELELIDPKLVLPVGALAIKETLGVVRLSEVVGTVITRDGRYWLPLPHSSPVSRWLNDERNRRRVGRAIRLLSELRVQLGLG